MVFSVLFEYEFPLVPRVSINKKHCFAGENEKTLYVLPSLQKFQYAYRLHCINTPLKNTRMPGGCSGVV